MSTWMQTYLGHAFDPTDPDPELINIQDIAHALSLTCRYGGHSRKFYSVAEHCVHISGTVAPEHALWALLHDATEAYVGDLIYPLKAVLPAFEEIEDRLMNTICQRFDLHPVQPSEVKEHDLRIVLDEKTALMVEPPKPWPAVEGLEPLGVTIGGWSPEYAESRYLRRYSRLTANKENRNG